MTSQLKWRLSKLPTVDELLKLVSDKVITQEEAKEVLFNKETESERDIESYKQEIKFLKEVIEKLGDKDRIVTVVKEYVPHYITQPFYQPYWTYVTCGSNSGTCGSYTDTATAGTAYLDCSNSSCLTSDGNGSCNFSSIVS